MGSRGFQLVRTIGLAAALSLLGTSARADNQCERVQHHRPPRFDVEPGQCAPVNNALRVCKPLHDDCEKVKRDSDASCNKVMDEAENPGACGPTQKFTHACSKAYNGRMKGVASAAAGNHHAWAEKIRKRRKKCKDAIEQAKAARSQEGCENADNDIQKLEQGSKDAKSFSQEVDNTGSMFDGKSQEFASNEATAGGFASNDSSMPNGPNDGTAGNAPEASPTEGAQPDISSASSAMPSSLGGGGPSQSVSDPGLSQPTAEAFAPPGPSSISAPGSGTAAPGGAAPAGAAFVADGGTTPASAAAIASPSEASQTAQIDKLPGSPVAAAATADLATPSPAAEPAIATGGLRDQLMRGFANSSGSSSSRDAESGDPAAGILPANIKRDPASGKPAAEGDGEGDDAKAADASSTDTLETFSKPLSDPKISLAGSETDRVINKLLGQADGMLAAGTAGSLPVEIGAKDGASLFDRTHSELERSLRVGRVRGMAIR